MNLPELLQKLEADSIIEVFEFDLRAIGGTEVFRFFDGTRADGSSLVWQGLTYNPWPVQAEGFEKTAKGTLPRPTVAVANVFNTLVPYLEDYEDFVGAKVVRKRTFARYLDGQPTADPNQHYPDETYFVERKLSDDGTVISFELASALDLEGVKLPARQITVNNCAWVYREPGGFCPYIGNKYFNALDEPVATIEMDVCSKTPNGCKIRFSRPYNVFQGAYILPFGGFPAARTYKL